VAPLHPRLWWDERALPRLMDVVLAERTAGIWRERAWRTGLEA